MIGAIIAISIVLSVIGGVTGIVVSYFRLQRHRADVVTMVGYRKLAEQAVANQEQTGRQIALVTASIHAAGLIMQDAR